MRLVRLETDVLVAGGGLAGVCAAIAAARNGAKVVLVQDRSRLGGNSSSEVKMHVVGANHHTARPGWREGGLIEELRLADAVNNPQRCWELWDLLLYDKVISEPNITLLLETVLYTASVKGGRITEVMARCDKSEHIYRNSARRCSATARAIPGWRWRRAPRCGAGARGARSTTSRWPRRRPTIAPSVPASCSRRGFTGATCRLHRRPGHARSRGSNWFTGASRPGNTATGGSNGAGTRTSLRTTSASASSCFPS